MGRRTCRAARSAGAAIADGSARSGARLDPRPHLGRRSHRHRAAGDGDRDPSPRNPVVLAKQVATLGGLSAGRVMLGVGAGYLRAEFEAVAANFAERGGVTDEYLDAMHALWYDEHPEYHGRFVEFAGVDAHPRPVQQPIP